MFNTAFTAHGDTHVEISLVSAKEWAMQRTTTKSDQLGSNRGETPLTLSITGSNELSIRGIVAMPRQAYALA
jgi:hypothetical protein